MSDLDRTIHEPIRLRIMCLLAGADSADFKFLLTALGASTGNLSSHMDKLEQAEYVQVDKGFNGKVPRTTYRLTSTGRAALEQHWSQLDEIRRTSEPDDA